MSEKKGLIDPTRVALKRRAQAYQDGRILVASFVGSEQQKDLNRTKGEVKGAVEDYFRVKSNIKPEPWEAYKKSGNARELMFDFNWWPIAKLGDTPEKREPENWNNQFIYQLKACNIACDYCFVDRRNNNGVHADGARFFDVSELVATFLEVREQKAAEGIRLNVIRASGGEPSLVPEQWLDMLQAVERAGMSNDIYVMSDSNLTTGPALDNLMASGQVDHGLLKEIAQYDNFGLLSCFKGTDPKGFSEDTNCNPDAFHDAIPSYMKYLESGIRIYPHMANPNPETLEGFMGDLNASLGEDATSMIHIFSLGAYGPVVQRLGERLDETKARWAKNITGGEEILDRTLKEKSGVGYKETPRPETLSLMMGNL